MPEGSETVLAIANPRSESLRTTVPKWIVEQFGLAPGDSLLWKLEVRDKSLIVVVEPVRVRNLE